MTVIPVQPSLVKLKYEGIHLSHSTPPMPCLHLHVPLDMEQLVSSSAPVRLQSQAVHLF